MDSDVIKKAKNLADFAEQHMPIVIEKIRYRRKPIDISACYYSLSRDHLSLGVRDYLINGDIQGFKQHFYVASKLILETVSMEDAPSFAVGNEIFHALLSDNSEIISAMAHVETPKFISGRNNPLTSMFSVHMMQLAIRGDDAALQEKIEKLAKHGKKPERTESISGQDFFSLLLKKDKSGLERLIQNKHALIKNSDPLFEDFVSFVGGWETKLCWFRGVPVQIESALVPMNLMPIQPLAHYDDVYEFLKPGWSPPPQGMLSVFSRWFKRDGNAINN